MKEELLGLNHWVSFSATCHTVRPRSSALSSGHLRIAPPKSSSRRPKCFRYQAASAALSPLLLKKTPPIPVIFAIVALLLVWPCARRTTTRARRGNKGSRHHQTRHHLEARALVEPPRRLILGPHEEVE